MINKIKTFFWYLKQPKGVGLIVNLVKRATVYRRLENTSEESVKWCEERALETDKALKKLFPQVAFSTQSLPSRFPAEFEYAQNKFNSSPYKMGGSGNLDFLFDVCETVNANYVLETGVAYGWSSLAVLLSLRNREGSVLVSTDMPYPKMGNENFVGVVVPDSLRKNWKLYKEADISALPKAFQVIPHLDVVHYDSDKSYTGRMGTYPLLYDKLKKGGVFISDDIQDNVAFRDYCQAMKIDPVIISFEGKYVGVFIK